MNFYNVKKMNMSNDDTNTTREITKPGTEAKPLTSGISCNGKSKNT